MSEQWLLNAEETEQAFEVWSKEEAPTLSWDEFLAQAQLRKVVEEGEKECPHDGGEKRVSSFPKRRCPICWQALRKEAGLEE